MTPNDVVGSAITILGKGLDAHITRVMAPMIGELEWPVVLKEIDAGKGKIGYEYSRHDVAMQLRMVTERLGAMSYPFDEGDRNRTMSCYGGILRIFRKRWAHNDEFSHFEASHLLDTVRIVMMHIGDAARAEEVAALHAGLVDELVNDTVDRGAESEQKLKHALDEDAWPDQFGLVTTCQGMGDWNKGAQTPAREPGLQGFRSASHETVWEPWEVSVMGVQEDLDRLRTKAAQQNARAIIEVIVDTEAPIHAERLAKLVGNAFGLKRVQRDRVKSILHQVTKSDVVKDNDGFVWAKSVDPQRWLLYRSCGEGVRAFDDVSPVELANAIVAVLTNKGSLDLDALRYAVMNAFGRKKTSKTVTDHFKKGLAQALIFGRIVEIDGVVTLVPAAEPSDELALA